MIRFSLKCPSDHGFESWFQSGAAFETLRAAGHVACPVCGSTGVEKSLMAPSVRPARNAAGKPDLSTPETDAEKALAELRRKVEETSEYVGLDFVTEARRMHEGAVPERAIYGEARLDEAKKLVEDGVPVAPLPFMPQRRTN
ncbi:DUF1178 family protein [Paragemmobacter straminiformis]|uniref:DUF1178 family protein n=1 Tax=Paragemmobacter straminiformis TaxID=2045119 RepID=A0A842I302_9RHOB|nr:DUF1178 family protein [Gemmobacter straminiformis]MBC2833935.1 DUF1178 family protein [Gemmobacter straminiformis]